MRRPATKDVLMILARDFAEHLATPLFLIDTEGTLIFFNEAAEDLLGRSFAETGELTMDEWGTMWFPESLDGGKIDTEDLPLSIALSQKRAAHSPIQIIGLDGAKRLIEVTAFPLLGQSGRLVGAVAVFWEERRKQPR